MTIAAKDTTTEDVTLVRLLLYELAVAAGDNNNCICLDALHRTPGCPQHPQGGEGR